MREGRFLCPLTDRLLARSSSLAYAVYPNQVILGAALMEGHLVALAELFPNIRRPLSGLRSTEQEARSFAFLTQPCRVVPVLPPKTGLAKASFVAGMDQAATCGLLGPSDRISGNESFIVLASDLDSRSNSARRCFCNYPQALLQPGETSIAQFHSFVKG